MRGGTQAAVAIGVGYLLGRRRRLRLATVLAVGAASGGIAALGGAGLRRGVQALGSPEALGKLGPQFGDVADALRGDLVDAGKAAAMAAVTGRIEALTDSLHDRAESLRNPAVGGDEPEDDEPEDDYDEYEDDEPEDEDDEPEDEDEDDDWADEDEAPVTRGRSRRG